MKRRTFVNAVPALFVLTACGDSAPTGGGPPPPPPPPPTPTDPVPGADVTVRIEDNRFVDPDGRSNASAVVTINTGDTVGWRRVGGNVHTVTSTAVPPGAQAFDSGNLGGNGTFTVTPSVAGIYMYRCDLHPATMLNARIVVQ